MSETAAAHVIAAHEESASGIVVTAQRRLVPLEEVPISITAFDAPALERLGAEGVEDIARAVPNFTVAPTGTLGLNQLSIRGIYSPAGSATVGLYIDDVPVQIRSLDFSSNPDLRVFDLERVEVLRGPQGTLFGGSSMGGTVRFIARQPDLERTEKFATAEVAATDGGDLSHEAQGALGTPLVSGKAALRVSAYYRRDGGYVDVSDRDTGALRSRNVDDVAAVGLRVAVRIAPSDTFGVTPGLLYQRIRETITPSSSVRWVHTGRHLFIPNRVATSSPCRA